MNAEQADITLGPERREHETFLYRLYASVRQPELDAWGWPEAVRETFLRVQFKAQQNFRAAYPLAESVIVFRNGEPIGRLIVCRTESEIRLLDIALVPEHRGQGIGSMLIRRLMADAAESGRALRLEVLKGHPAAGLYQRLGFKRIGGTEVHDEMEAGTE
jgi:ribosomal protein S18 acetylase RimI-like enzyme